jgi:hypothetical protein
MRILHDSCWPGKQVDSVLTQTTQNGQHNIREGAVRQIQESGHDAILDLLVRRRAEPGFSHLCIPALSVVLVLPALSAVHTRTSFIQYGGIRCSSYLGPIKRPLEQLIANRMIKGGLQACDLLDDCLMSTQSPF